MISATRLRCRHGRPSRRIGRIGIARGSAWPAAAAATCPRQRQAPPTSLGWADPMAFWGLREALDRRRYKACSQARRGKRTEPQRRVA